MKLILEDANLTEVEVLVRGNLSDPKIAQLVTLLKTASLSGRLIATQDGREVLLSLSDITCFAVQDRRVLAFSGGACYTVPRTLAELLTLFSGQGLVQIGKSLLVNLRHIKCLEAEFSGNYIVTLHDGTKLIASRFYMKGLRAAIWEELK